MQSLYLQGREQGEGACSGEQFSRAVKFTNARLQTRAAGGGYLIDVEAEHPAVVGGKSNASSYLRITGGGPLVRWDHLEEVPCT